MDNPQIYPPVVASSPKNGERLLGTWLSRMWPLFVINWPVFVIIGPVATMLEAPDAPLGTLATLAWAAAFVTAYLWLTLHKPFRSEVTRGECRLQIGLLLLLTGLILYIDIANEPGYSWLFICAIIPAGAVLPSRAAAWMVVVIAALAAGVEVARSEWPEVMTVPGMAIWGVSTIMLRRLVLTVDELRVARVELARLAVTEERLRFARDLHDLLGHSLSLIALKSELAGRLVQTQRERAASEIADIEQVARRALREGREAVAGYRHTTLGDELASARELLVAAGIEPRIDAGVGAFPPAIDTVLAWTVREGTTNVIRHSGARRCQIRVTREDGIVHANVIDDGRGIPTPESTELNGFGLTGLAERVARSGGWMTSGPGDDGGFRLCVVLPITAAIRPSTIAANPTLNGAVHP